MTSNQTVIKKKPLELFKFSLFAHRVTSQFLYLFLDIGLSL